MDESRRLTVAKLAQAESRARQTFEALGTANTAHLTTEQRVDLDAKYAFAQAIWCDAVTELRRAILPPPQTDLQWRMGEAQRASFNPQADYMPSHK